MTCFCSCSRGDLAGVFLELGESAARALGIEHVRTDGARWSYTGKTHGSGDLVMAVGLAVGYACHLHPPPGLWENL